jgi:hypothetical protein
MEFGSPHLTVREPIAASSGASPKVKRNLAKRRISIVGNWHLWIKYAEWEIHTTSYSMRSQDLEFALIEEALSELDGQILLSADPGEIPYSCLLKFDLGASLHIWPSPEIGDDQWSIYEFGGSILSCKTDGSIILEPSNR